jgi:hypothetical protein
MKQVLVCDERYFCFRILSGDNKMSVGSVIE